MQTTLKWKKNYFSNLYSIYSKGQQIGILKDKAFSQTAYGALNGKKYTFKTKGFFKQRTKIVDRSVNQVIGEITYNQWMTKATIVVNHKTVHWKVDNLWNTKWRIFDSEGIIIHYAGSSTSGRVDSKTDDALLLLSGLFVTNYYWQTTVALMVAIFVPIWAAVSG